MEVWLYSNGTELYALTGDSDGSNLPAHLGPWSKRQSVTLCALDADEQKAIELITEHGYCCFD